MGLSAKHEIFAQVLAETDDQSNAYRAMVPKTKASDKSIWQTASKLSKNPKVISRVRELKEKAREVAEEVFEITAEQKLRWLKTVVDRSLQNEAATDSDGNVLGDYKFGGGDVVRAVNEMNKMSGDHAAEKVDLTLNPIEELMKEIEGSVLRPKG